MFRHYKAAVFAVAFCVVRLLGGCVANRENTVTKSVYQLVIPSAADRYTLKKNQEFLLGERIGTAVLPEYPAPEVTRRLPEQHLCVEIDIGKNGRVSASRPLYGVAGCPARIAGPDGAFYVSAEKAVARWAFEPARLCTFPANVAKNSGCCGDGVKVDLVPIRLAFMFSFTQEHGPHVTSQSVMGTE